MDQKVWSKAVADTLGLEAYHQLHRSDYMWDSRTHAYLVSCTEDANIEALRKAQKKIAKGKLDQAALNAKYCSNDTVPCITLLSLLVEKGENEMVDAQNGVPGLGPVMTEEGTTSFIIVKEVRSPEPKELDDSRGQITSDYQNYLEIEWINALKEKYPVEVDKSLLSKIKE